MKHKFLILPFVLLLGIALIFLFKPGYYYSSCTCETSYYWKKPSKECQNLCKVESSNNIQNVVRPEIDSETDPVLENKKYFDAWYSILGNSVYLNNYDSPLLVKNADAKTFEIINHEVEQGSGFRGFFKDKSRLYNVFDDNARFGIENSDPKTFKYLSDHFSKDDNQIYYDSWTQGGPIFYIVESVDTSSFETLANDVYAKDKSGVYSISWDGVKRIPNADPKSFVDLVDGGVIPFAKDKNYVYYGGVQIPGVDVDSVVPLRKNDGPASYIKDDSKAYYCDADFLPEGGSIPTCRMISGADVATFDLVKQENGNYWNQFIAKDKNNVYSAGDKFPKADPKSFIVTDLDTAEDRNSRYTLECEMIDCKLRGSVKIENVIGE